MVSASYVMSLLIAVTQEDLRNILNIIKYSEREIECCPLFQYHDLYGPALSTVRDSQPLLFFLIINFQLL